MLLFLYLLLQFVHLLPAVMFVYRDTVNANLICCICRHPFIEPTSTLTCGHTFCLECIREALSHTPQCPVDRSSLRLDDLRPAHTIIRNLVDELLVECPNRAKGCTETPQRHTATIHERDVCGYTPVPCPSKKCNSRPLRKDLATHQATCDRRSIKCPACLQTISLADAQAHADECPRGVVGCSDCGLELSREELAGHTDTCPLSTVLCTYATVGCGWVGIREDLESIHLLSCPYEALKGFFAIHAKESANLRAENTALREEICTLRANVRDLTNDVSKARYALGPWFKSVQQPSISTPQVVERVPGRRRLSSPFANGVLGFTSDGVGESASDPSTSLSDPGNPRASPSGTSSPPGESLSVVPNLILQDFVSRTRTQSSIAPINVDTTLERSLGELRNSVVTLSSELESLSRRQDMHFTTEMLRMHEEVASLRATVHGLRMQVCMQLCLNNSF